MDSRPGDLTLLPIDRVQSFFFVSESAIASLAVIVLLGCWACFWAIWKVPLAIGDFVPAGTLLVLVQSGCSRCHRGYHWHSGTYKRALSAVQAAFLCSWHNFLDGASNGTRTKTR